MVILLNRVPTIKRNNTMFLTAGFFASKTIRVDFDPLQAMNNYGMRDEQEKCFALQKGLLDTTASGPGPREEKEAECLYISSDSSLLHTYDPYGRRTMCCARSSLQPKLCSQKCAPYDA